MELVILKEVYTGKNYLLHENGSIWTIPIENRSTILKFDVLG